MRRSSHQASKLTVLLLAAALNLGTLDAWGWGAEGHRVTGLVAAEMMTARARIRLNDIIPGADLGDIANYMDLNRPNLLELIPGIDKWHYDNQPVCQTRTFEQYCPKGECASARIPTLMKILADSANPPEIRALAARFLVHMVGDVHQPLHAADDDDAGANFKNVLLPGNPTPRRLHSAWDSDFVKLALKGSSEGEYAQQLLSTYRKKDMPEWQKGDIRDWMNDSYEVSKAVTYAKLPSFVCAQPWTATPIELPQAYVDAAVAAIPAQLAKAGARIAAVLNRALDPVPFIASPPPTTPPVPPSNPAAVPANKR